MGASLNCNTACVECEEDGAGQPEFSPFAGRWVSGKGNRHLVGLGGILWADGAVTPLVVSRGWMGGATCYVKHRGEDFTGVITKQGEIKWNDGDVWTREPVGAEPATETARQCGLSPTARSPKSVKSAKSADSNANDRSCSLGYDAIVGLLGFGSGGECAAEATAKPTDTIYPDGKSPKTQREYCVGGGSDEVKPEPAPAANQRSSC